MTQRVAGVDEAGRGPLAGPVVVAAVILDPDRPIEGLADSKKLSETRREVLYAQIVESALAWSVIAVTPAEIDRINVLQATLAGMRRAVASLEPPAQMALIDGNRAPELPCPSRTVIGGDALEPAISAASILAKVTRDRHMCALHERFPDYGFDRHKGYGTGAHMQALRNNGPCAVHRRSFRPVRAAAGASGP